MTHFLCNSCDHFFAEKDAIEVPATELVEGIHDRPSYRQHITQLRCPQPKCYSANIEQATPCKECKKNQAMPDDSICYDCFEIEKDHPGERTAVEAEHAWDHWRETLADITGAKPHVR